MRTKTYYIVCLFLCLSTVFSYAEDNYIDPWDEWGYNDSDSLWIDKINGVPETYKEIGNEVHVNDPISLAYVSLMSNKDTSYYQDKTIYLDNDISLSGNYWSCIRLNKGIIDGQGHTVSGLETRIEDSSSEVGGAFIDDNKGVVRNLKIDKSRISYSSDDTDWYSNSSYSILVGRNYGTLDNCEVNADVYIELLQVFYFRTMVALCVAYNEGNVTNCRSNGKIDVNVTAIIPMGKVYVGGVVGYSLGDIDRSYNSANLTTNAYSSGGIAGYMGGVDSMSYVSNCVNKGSVKCDGLSSLYDTSNQMVFCGGIVGSMGDQSYIANCCNMSDGYFAGYFKRGSQIYNSVNLGDAISCPDDNGSYNYIYANKPVNVSAVNPNSLFTRESLPVLNKEVYGTNDLVGALNSWVADQSWISSNGVSYQLWNYDIDYKNQGFPVLVDSVPFPEFYVFDMNYCADMMNSSVRPLDSCVQIAVEDIRPWNIRIYTETGTLLPELTMPDLSRPGMTVYYASLLSKATGKESEKHRFVITVEDPPILLGEFSVEYSMDDAIDGVYPSLLEQNPNVVDMNFLYDAEVFWFDDNFMQLPTVPTPVHDESWNDGSSHTKSYSIGAVNHLGCQSLATITVTFIPSKDKEELDCEKPVGKWKDNVSSSPSSYREIGDSIIINDENAFVWFATECNGSSTGMEGKMVVLNHNIDLCGRYWSPIKNFSGIFDGQGHSISGLRTVREDYVSNSGALFAKNSGTIYNLHLKNTQIKDSIISSTLYSSLVGLNTGIVKKCSNNGIIDVRTDKNRGTTKTGGLVAENQGTVEDCKSYGAIYVKYASGFTENMTGGIVGYNNKGLVNACINEAKVVANGMSVGGVVGTTNYKVYNCANRNTILGKTYFGSGEGALYLGGVVGVLGKSEAILENSYNIAYTDGNSLVGEADGQTMVNCYKINSKPSLQDTYNFSYTYYLTDSVPTPTPYQGNYGFSKDSEGSFILEKESWGTTDLVEALNAWVDNQKDSVFMHWSYDTLNINSGYPCLTLDYDIIECLPFDSVGLYTRDEIVCKESPFHVKISGGDINRWYVNDSFLIDADECDITISSNMNYSVLTVEVSVGTCNYIINDTIHFESLVPFVMKGWDDVIAISNADSIFTSYQWYRDGVELHGETDQYFYESGGLSSGSYQTVVWKTDGSSQKSCPVVVKNDMSTRGTSPYIDVYPNPARENDVFIVSMQNVHSSDIESLQIADNTGSVVWNSKKISFNQEISLSQGVYIVYAKLNSGKIISNKIVVVK